MSVSITTTYAGEFAGKYISAALLSGETLDKGNIEIKPNVKYKEVIKTFSSDSNLIKDASCGFTDAGTVTLAERIIQPEEFQVNLELCKKTLEMIGKLFKWDIQLTITYLQNLLIS